jgi:hypothetical protein
MPAGGPPDSLSAASLSLPISDTSMNSSLAVRVMFSLIRVGSVTPGSCSRTRFRPWTTISGSRRPKASMRRPRICFTWSTERFRIWSAAASRKTYTCLSVPSPSETKSSGKDLLTYSEPLSMEAESGYSTLSQRWWASTSTLVKETRSERMLLWIRSA